MRVLNDVLSILRRDNAPLEHNRAVYTMANDNTRTDGTNDATETAKYRITDGTRDADNNLVFKTVEALTAYADGAPDRISNLKKVSEQHDDLKDAKLRALIRQGRIYINAKVYPGDDDDDGDVIVYRVTNDAIEDYRARVASGEYGTRSDTKTHTAMIATVPNDKLDAFTAFCKENGILAVLRYKAKDTDADNDADNAPSAENVNEENKRRTRASAPVA